MNANFFNKISFGFKIDRLTHVSFYVQSVSLPGLNLGETIQPSPLLNLKRHGDQIGYDDLTVTVRLDAEMKCYTEIMTWMIGLAYPDHSNQFANLSDGEGLYSGAVLMVYDPRSNPFMELNFRDVFPKSLGTIQLDSSDTEKEAPTLDITFAHNGFSTKLLT